MTVNFTFRRYSIYRFQTVSHIWSTIGCIRYTQTYSKQRLPIASPQFYLCSFHAAPRQSHTSAWSHITWSHTAGQVLFIPLFSNHRGALDPGLRLIHSKHGDRCIHKARSPAVSFGATPDDLSTQQLLWLVLFSLLVWARTKSDHLWLISAFSSTWTPLTITHKLCQITFSI